MVKSSSDENEDEECPLCLDRLDATDRVFFACTCNYQVCMFCVQHIRDYGNGTCPACRQPYDDSNFRFLGGRPGATEEAQRPSSQIESEQPAVAAQRVSKTSKEPTSSYNKKEATATLSQQQKTSPDKKGVSTAKRVFPEITDESLRSKLVDVLKSKRVPQRNSVYVTNIVPALALDTALRDESMFGKYGKILRVTVSDKAFKPRGSDKSFYAATIVYEKDTSAAAAIAALDGDSSFGEGALSVTPGQNRYCVHWLEGQECFRRGNCNYLHELYEGHRDLKALEKEAATKGGKNALKGSGKKGYITASVSTGKGDRYPIFSGPAGIPLTASAPSSGKPRGALVPDPTGRGSGTANGTTATSVAPGSGVLFSSTAAASSSKTGTTTSSSLVGEGKNKKGLGKYKQAQEVEASSGGESGADTARNQKTSPGAGAPSTSTKNDGKNYNKKQSSKDAAAAAAAVSSSPATAAQSKCFDERDAPSPASKQAFEEMALCDVSQGPSVNKKQKEWGNRKWAIYHHEKVSSAYSVNEWFLYFLKKKKDMLDAEQEQQKAAATATTTTSEKSNKAAPPQAGPVENNPQASKNGEKTHNKKNKKKWDHWEGWEEEAWTQAELDQWEKEKAERLEKKRAAKQLSNQESPPKTPPIVVGESTKNATPLQAFSGADTAPANSGKNGTTTSTSSTNTATSSSAPGASASGLHQDAGNSMKMNKRNQHTTSSNNKSGGAAEVEASPRGPSEAVDYAPKVPPPSDTSTATGGDGEKGNKQKYTAQSSPRTTSGRSKERGGAPEQKATARAAKKQEAETTKKQGNGGGHQQVYAIPQGPKPEGVPDLSKLEPPTPSLPPSQAPPASVSSATSKRVQKESEKQSASSKDSAAGSPDRTVGGGKEARKGKKNKSSWQRVDQASPSSSPEDIKMTTADVPQKTSSEVKPRPTQSPTDRLVPTAPQLPPPGAFAGPGFPQSVPPSGLSARGERGEAPSSRPPGFDPTEGPPPALGHPSQMLAPPSIPKGPPPSTIPQVSPPDLAPPPALPPPFVPPRGAPPPMMNGAPPGGRAPVPRPPPSSSSTAMSRKLSDRETPKNTTPVNYSAFTGTPQNQAAAPSGGGMSSLQLQAPPPGSQPSNHKHNFAPSFRQSPRNSPRKQQQLQQQTFFLERPQSFSPPAAAPEGPPPALGHPPSALLGHPTLPPALPPAAARRFVEGEHSKAVSLTASDDSASTSGRAAGCPNLGHEAISASIQDLVLIDSGASTGGSLGGCSFAALTSRCFDSNGSITEEETSSARLTASGGTVVDGTEAMQHGGSSSIANSTMLDSISRISVNTSRMDIENIMSHLQQPHEASTSCGAAGSLAQFRTQDEEEDGRASVVRVTDSQAGVGATLNTGKQLREKILDEGVPGSQRICSRSALLVHRSSDANTTNCGCEEGAGTTTTAGGTTSTTIGGTAAGETTPAASTLKRAGPTVSKAHVGPNSIPRISATGASSAFKSTVASSTTSSTGSAASGVTLPGVTNAGGPVAQEYVVQEMHSCAAQHQILTVRMPPSSMPGAVSPHPLLVGGAGFQQQGPQQPTCGALQALSLSRFEGSTSNAGVPMSGQMPSPTQLLAPHQQLRLAPRIAAPEAISTTSGNFNSNSGMLIAGPPTVGGVGSFPSTAGASSSSCSDQHPQRQNIMNASLNQPPAPAETNPRFQHYGQPQHQFSSVPSSAPQLQSTAFRSSPVGQITRETLHMFQQKSSLMSQSSSAAAPLPVGTPAPGVGAVISGLPASSPTPAVVAGTLHAPSTSPLTGMVSMPASAASAANVGNVLASTDIPTSSTSNSVYFGFTPATGAPSPLASSSSSCYPRGSRLANPSMLQHQQHQQLLVQQSEGLAQQLIAQMMQNRSQQQQQQPMQQALRGSLAGLCQQQINAGSFVQQGGTTVTSAIASMNNSTTSNTKSVSTMEAPVMSSTSTTVPLPPSSSNHEGVAMLSGPLGITPQQHLGLQLALQQQMSMSGPPSNNELLTQQRQQTTSSTQQGVGGTTIVQATFPPNTRRGSREYLSGRGEHLTDVSGRASVMTAAITPHHGPRGSGVNLLPHTNSHAGSCATTNNIIKGDNGGGGGPPSGLPLQQFVQHPQVQTPTSTCNKGGAGTTGGPVVHNTSKASNHGSLAQGMSILHILGNQAHAPPNMAAQEQTPS
ncbi:unnamed protein product [Amoebophrya sp. A25]|nr:unnamed protein product [Amoebophrya sp. A25]|eukprot:GSA25T00016611001.1